MLKIYSLELANHTSAIKSLCLENSIPVEIVPTSPMTGENKTPEFLKVSKSKAYIARFDVTIF